MSADIIATLTEAEEIVSRYKNPALLVSFGKDSLAMLDLLKHIRLPVICYQTPFQRDRWQYANEMAARFGVTLYDYPPEWTALQEGPQGALEAVTAYTIGGKQVIGIRQAVHHWDEGICGLHDFIRRPRGGIAFQWDLLLSAQKSGDTDHFGGRIDITVAVKQSIGAADVYFPLRGWSDDDVLNYCRKERVPLDLTRYDERDGRIVDDENASPDHIHGCFACLRKDTPDAVPCPRLGGRLVNNVSASIAYLAHDTRI